MKNTLLAVPASHPSLAAELMLRRKGIDYERIDLVAALHKPIVRAIGFPDSTVPALVLDRRRLQGSRNIARALDVLVPEPSLFPLDPARRAEVERAELWGDLVLQPAARRLAWAALKRDHSTISTFLEGARLGIPNELAARTAAPVVWLAARGNRASDRSARRDLAALPKLLESVDALVERGVVGGHEPNAADFQLATSVRLLMTLEDLREPIARHSAGWLAAKVVPDFPGHLPPLFPREWLSVR